MLSDDERRLWEARTAEDADRENNPLWRLRWLYSIIDREGRLVPFEPTVEQIEVIMAIHVRGWRRILIPKARQLGMSTVLVLIAFRRRKKILAWWQARRQSASDALANDESLSSAP